VFGQLPGTGVLHFPGTAAPSPAPAARKLRTPARKLRTPARKVSLPIYPGNLPGNLPGTGVLQFPIAPSRAPALVYQPGSVPGTGLLTQSSIASTHAPAEPAPEKRPLCNHCRKALSTADTATCARCRGGVCGDCAGELDRACPRPKRKHEDLWIPDAERRGLDGVPWTPATCPNCGSVQWPRDLRPTEHGWGCPACLDEDERAAWMLCEFRETTREQVCGTWNMQKYGEDTNDDKTGLVLDGLVAMLRAETPDWILVQEVTSGTRFAKDLRARLGHEKLPYDCSGHELTLGRGSTQDHYVLIYHVAKIAIIMGPLHVGANEGPEHKTQVPFWRDKKGGVEGKVLPHRGSVVWLTCSLPYNGPYSLTWVMGVHTSPSGATNKIPAQIHEIMTHAAKLRHLGVPVVLAGDWYMQKCAPDYSSKLDAAEWTLLATYYGTSLKHKNTEHEIQAADHLVVSDVCEVAWVRQYVPVSSVGQRLQIRHLGTPACLDPKSFAMRATPVDIWNAMKRWFDQGVDHTPVLARFTILPVRGRATFVPGDLSSTIDDWQRSGLTSRPGVGDLRARQTPRSYLRTTNGNDRESRRQPVLPLGTPAQYQPPQTSPPLPASQPAPGQGFLPPPRRLLLPPLLSTPGHAPPHLPPRPTGAMPSLRPDIPRVDSPGARPPSPVRSPRSDLLADSPWAGSSSSAPLPEGQWREDVRSILGVDRVDQFGAHHSGSTLLTCLRMPACRQSSLDECGVRAAYNAHAFKTLLEDPTRHGCTRTDKMLTNENTYVRITAGWHRLRERRVQTQGLHLAAISEVVPSGTLVLPLLRTNDGVAVYENSEAARVEHCVAALQALRKTPGACLFVAGRVQFGGSETHALAGILRSYGTAPRIAWEIVFADSSPTKGFDDDTMKLFDVIVKWLDHPEWMLKRSLSEQKQ
jgi:hypothetical protein